MSQSTPLNAEKLSGDDRSIDLHIPTPQRGYFGGDSFMRSIFQPDWLLRADQGDSLSADPSMDMSVFVDRRDSDGCESTTELLDFSAFWDYTLCYDDPLEGPSSTTPPADVPWPPFEAFIAEDALCADAVENGDTDIFSFIEQWDGYCSSIPLVPLDYQLCQSIGDTPLSCGTLPCDPFAEQYVSFCADGGQTRVLVDGPFCDAGEQHRRSITFQDTENIISKRRARRPTPYRSPISIRSSRDHRQENNGSADGYEE